MDIAEVTRKRKDPKDEIEEKVDSLVENLWVSPSHFALLTAAAMGGSDPQPESA